MCTCRLWKKITRQAYKIILKLNERLSHALILSSAFPWDKTLGQLGKIAGKNGWCQVDNFMQGLGKFNMLKSPVWKLLNEKKKTWYPTGVTSGDSQWYSRTLLTETQTSGIEEQSFSVKLRVIAVLWRLKYIVTMWL